MTKWRLQGHGRSHQGCQLFFLQEDRPVGTVCQHAKRNITQTQLHERKVNMSGQLIILGCLVINQDFVYNMIYYTVPVHVCTMLAKQCFKKTRFPIIRIQSYKLTFGVDNQVVAVDHLKVRQTFSGSSCCNARPASLAVRKNRFTFKLYYDISGCFGLTNFLQQFV